MAGESHDVLPEEVPLLRLIEGLRGLDVSANESAIVSRIARFAQSPGLLAAIASVPKWYAGWDIREALYQNPSTPERYREPVAATIAAIDLMREMDRKDLAEAERNEIRDDIRSLLHGLPPVDHEVVKTRARALAAGARFAAAPPTVSIAELAAETEAASVREAAQAAAVAESHDVLLEALLDVREPVRRAALDNPRLAEATLLEAFSTAKPADLLLETATTPRWCFRDAVRRAVLRHPGVPAPVAAMLGRTEGLLMAFVRYFNEPLEPQERGQLAKGILAEVQELPLPEREYLKYRVGPAWKPFVAEVMRTIEDEFRNLHPTPVTTAWPTTAPPAEVTPPGTGAAEAARPSPSEARGRAAPLDEPRHGPAHAPRPPPPSGVTRRSLAGLPWEERAGIARATQSGDEISFLLHDADDRVFAALLANQAVGDRELVAAAGRASRERIRRITDSRAFTLLAVKHALLHNPSCPESFQLDCLSYVSAPRELLAVMRDPKVRSVVVKAKARMRLHERFRAMTTEERVAAIKTTGGELLSELWTEAFSDERTLMRLLEDQGLPEGIALRIARSRIAPRAVLVALAREPRFTNSYQVRLELAMNPKTPREVVAKLVPKLSPADRQRLRATAHLADAVREMA